jgi:glyoxylase-like metal-dependent hydrolase (beta-lactamase superfamily II)
VTDQQPEAALARSFLAGLPPEVSRELQAEGERADYPAGTTVYRPGAPPQAALVVSGLIRVPFTESLDVMGDGSLVLLPTPGHTAGSMSLLVRRTGRPLLLLAGDLTYGADILQRGQLPGVGRRRQLSQSTRQVLALEDQQPGLVVLPAHDPTAAQRLLDS